MVTRSRPQRATRKAPTPAVPAPPGATDYADFVIHAQRRDARTIEVRVHDSPAGEMKDAQVVRFPAREAAELRGSFRSRFQQAEGGPASTQQSVGRMLMKQADATALGKRLASVLFPPPVFSLLMQSLGEALRRPAAGLRIRLALDEALVDLPWEYVYRPDRLEGDGVSGFLLLDPAVSIVREAANPRITLRPITGRQPLRFVGTLWDGKYDGWEVWKEFTLLRDALKPVSAYIAPSFVAGAAEDFEEDFRGGAAIFHYAGHCDFDGEGRAFIVCEMPTTGRLEDAPRVYADVLARRLARAGTRLAVLSACNSGYWPVVKPLLDAGVPAVVGVNGAVASVSTIEFCAKMYESLAVGLTLDEAVDRARLHLLEWGQQYDLFDWGLFMVYMPSPRAELFPRPRTKAVAERQETVRRDHAATISSSVELARELDGMNFGEIMSELTRRRVLILGRFTGRRLKVLEAIRQHLRDHPNRYIAELFTFERPESRDLVEAIVGFAALSRFVVADVSEPRSVQSELEAIVPRFLSVPVVPIINRTGKEYATLSSILRRENVVQPTVRYRDLDDLLQKLDDQVVPNAEAKLEEVRPPA